MGELDFRKDTDRAYLAASLVGYALGVPAEAILAPGRGTEAASKARQISIYLLRTCMGISLSRSALAWQRDRTTIAYACAHIEERREDADFDDWLAQLEVGFLSVLPLGEDIVHEKEERAA